MTFPSSQEGWEEVIQGRFNRDLIVQYLTENPEDVVHLQQIALLQTAYAWRAAWVLKDVIGNYHNHQVFVNQAIQLLPNLKDGHQREILKTLQVIEISEDAEGSLFDACMHIWESPNKSPSVRMTAFLFILDTVKNYPELKSELQHLTQSHYMETLSPGLKRSLERRIVRVIPDFHG